MNRRISPFAWLLLFVFVHAAAVTSAEFQAGEYVVVAVESSLKINGQQVVDTVWPGLILKVDAINGEWLWLSNGKPGWLLRSKVIEISSASVDRLSEQIKANPADARLYSCRGAVQFALNRFDVAMADFDEAVRRSPKNPTVFYNRADAWTMSVEDDCEKAIADANVAIKLVPKSAVGYILRARALVRLGDARKAMADVNEAIRIDPGNAFAYYNRGRLWSGDESGKAMADFDSAVRIDSNEHRALISRGQLRLQLQKVDQAIDDFDRAIRILKHYPPAYESRAYAWVMKGEFDKAIADFDVAIRLNPNRSDLLLQRAHSFIQKQDYDRAASDAEKFLRLNPNDFRGFFVRGNVGLKQQEYDKAIADYSKALELQRGLPQAYVGRGKAWAKKGDFDEAINNFDIALEMIPGFVEAYFERGLAWFSKKEYGETIDDFSEAIRLNPKDVYAYLWRAKAWSEFGNMDKAFADFDAAIRLSPAKTEGYLHRAEAWLERGDFGKALADFTEAIRLEPKYARAYVDRGRAYCGDEQYDKAIADCDAALTLPSDKETAASAHVTKAIVQFLRRDPAAIESYQVAIELQIADSEIVWHSVVFGYLAALRAGDKQRADQLIATAQDLPQTWPLDVVRFLKGEIDEPTLLDAAQDDSAKSDVCLVLGLTELEKGNTDQALPHFEWIKENEKDKGSTTCMIAVFELNRLKRLTPEQRNQ